MNTKIIKDVEDLLTLFGKDVSKDIIECHSGDLSMLVNAESNRPYIKPFLGLSIYSVAKYYCELTNKTCNYIRD